MSNGIWSNGRDHRSGARGARRLRDLRPGYGRPPVARTGADRAPRARSASGRGKATVRRAFAGTVGRFGRARADQRDGHAGETGGFSGHPREPRPGPGLQHRARAGARRRSDRQDRVQGGAARRRRGTFSPRSTLARSRPRSTSPSRRRRRTRPRSPTPSWIWRATPRSPSRISPPSSSSTRRTPWSTS